MPVRIVTDSTCDLPQGLCDELNITVVPLLVHFGTEVYQDGVNLAKDDFYAKLVTSSAFPTTSTPSPSVFARTYQNLAPKADAILSIHLAASLSATCEAAITGARESGASVHVIDSRTASTGLGLLVVLASRAAADGQSAAQIRSLLEESIPNTVVYGLFETLEYLRKGGRIGRAQQFIGSLLKIRPIIAIQNGAIVPIDRARTQAKGIDKLCDLVHGFGEPRSLAIMATGTADADPLLDRFSADIETREVIRSKIGPVIGAHVGPGAIGVSVVRKNPGAEHG